MKSTLCHNCYTQTFYSSAHYGMICQCTLDRERQTEEAAKLTNQNTLFQVDPYEAQFLQRCLAALRSGREATITINGMTNTYNVIMRVDNAPFLPIPSAKTDPALSELLAGTIADFSEAKRAAFSASLRKRRG